MKSAKAFAQWLAGRVGHAPQGVYLTRDDIQQLTGRQRFTMDYITDVHFELAAAGWGLVSDVHREKFFMVRLPREHWLEYGDRYNGQAAQAEADNVRRLKG
ncbi:hypothetical protein [Gallaecimonas pentaromativorans]|uniref:Uncharacterized protein n=1 Tax=Gallaecimonas pentaromativorans TaxID=584787 RepID=A0A3N1PAD8_9GAMM|nr:hypothetical protein [Gallaecimonas pentaromativorans]MED5526227.1 hypothetical protein [Pseudomonadota bacterium]ROQ24381.1 hypothetical protein EDC28_107264 [Gallaecimonas pentaromativorans]